MHRDKAIENLAAELQITQREKRGEKLRQEIIQKIRSLVLHDMPALLALLYRVDVSEDKLRASIEENKGTDSALLITDMLIERQLQKMILRKKNSDNNKGENIPEDEKW